MRKPVVAVLALALVAVIGFGVWANHEPEERFCTLAGAMADPPPGHEDVETWLQDGGEPGRDGCDMGLPDGNDGREPVTDHQRLVLGFDCAYYDGNGEVVATTTPNRPDGLCGMDDR